MDRCVKLDVPPAILSRIEDGVQGYALTQRGRRLWLFPVEGDAIKIEAFGTDIAPKFECFALALDAMPAEVAWWPWRRVRTLRTAQGRECVDASRRCAFRKGAYDAAVLTREEYIQPFEGDASGLVGRNPVGQSAAKPGRAPLEASGKCRVEYGILLRSQSEVLAVCADWFPLRLDVATDLVQVSELLAESEAAPLQRYLDAY